MKDLLNTLNKKDFSKLKDNLQDKDPKLLNLLSNINKSNQKKITNFNIDDTKLKRDLKENIFETLFSSKIDTYFSLDYQKYDVIVKKKLILAKFSFVNKLYPTTKNLLKKCLKESLKFELYSNALEASKNLLILSGIQKNEKEIDEYIRLSNSLEKTNRIIHNSEMLYARSLYYIETGEIEVFFEYCDNNLKTLKKNLKKVDSSLIQFLYYDLASRYYIKKANSKKSIKFVSKLIKLLEDNEAMFSKKWLGHQKIKLAEICLYETNYKLGIIQIKDAFTILKGDSQSYFNALETYFYLTLNGGSYKDQMYILNEMKKNRPKSIELFSLDKIKFHCASTLFVANEKEKALKILQEIKFTAKNKKGWGLGVRLLEIMTLFELKMYDLLEYKLNNFRMYIYNQRLKNDTRIKYIYNCLRILTTNTSKSSKKLPATKFKKYLPPLKTNSSEFFWDPMGYESIRFDKWLDSKIISTDNS